MKVREGLCCMPACDRTTDGDYALCRRCVGRLTQRTARAVVGVYYRWREDPRDVGLRKRFERVTARAREEIAALSDGGGASTSVAERERRAASLR